MRKCFSIILIAALVISLFGSLVYANSRKTWANIGKGLAIYEGVKVLTGREGNIVDDVTGGMRPRRAAEAGDYDDSYNAGYKKGYEEGYNAGFRTGVEHTSK